MVLYRAPSLNLSEFLNRLDLILNILHTPKYEVVICGDINVVLNRRHHVTVAVSLDELPELPSET
jgi:exonuclease III